VVGEDEVVGRRRHARKKSSGTRREESVGKKNTSHAITLSHNESHDRAIQIKWCQTASGAYSVRSTYQIQFDGGLISSFPMMIWRVSGVITLQIFLVA
jgi:hypothetical protein